MELNNIKQSTLSHYQRLVRDAILRVTTSLDEALDLQELAAPACMAPLHFHRVFRGLVGETPLQLHRRLRLERAAWSLIKQEDSILRIAMDAGYETHEAFTRAFCEAFGRSPTEHRTLSREQHRLRGSDDTQRPLSHRLQAACGIHADGPDVDFPADTATLFIHSGVLDMQVQIEDRPEIRVAALGHTGPYNTINTAFEQLAGIAGPAGLFANPGASMIAIYYDDPESVPARQLRSAAGVTIAAGTALPDGLKELTLPAGRWACTLHRGSYSALGDAWQRFLGQWLPQSGHRLAGNECYERYLNNPGNTREADLETLLYAPLDA